MPPRNNAFPEKFAAFFLRTGEKQYRIIAPIRKPSARAGRSPFGPCSEGTRFKILNLAKTSLTADFFFPLPAAAQKYNFFYQMTRILYILQSKSSVLPADGPVPPPTGGRAPILP